MSWNSFNKLFIKTHLSWLIFGLIKALEIKTAMIFNLILANNNNMLLCFFFFLLIIDLFFLVPAIITQFFNAITELVSPIGISTKEAKAEMETHAIAAEM